MCSVRLQQIDSMRRDLSDLSNAHFPLLLNPRRAVPVFAHLSSLFILTHLLMAPGLEVGELPPVGE